MEGMQSQAEIEAIEHADSDLAAPVIATRLKELDSTDHGEAYYRCVAWSLLAKLAAHKPPLLVHAFKET